jgi:hypothetical protein
MISRSGRENYYSKEVETAVLAHVDGRLPDDLRHLGKEEKGAGRLGFASVPGKVKNGLIVLPPGTKLPEDAEVRVETIQVQAEDDPFIAAVERLPKPRAHLPEDYALNHGHYNRGEPKK